MEIKEWRWSGERAQWTEGRGAASAPADAVLRPDGREYQQMLGFGGCFNELGWRALSRLGEEERDAVLSELFGPGGCRFGLAACLSARTTTPSTGTAWTKSPATMS